ncbi:uncharacterized protein LOC108043205 isoform X2 [Drosophila rhopaloa]|uniref:Transforming acidic coiled-coil-containing protein C-terminal domain-containing protein n=1 Tax=Drosophila rhopaloa TaxID=1041015 RepID=A0ABM5HAR3_DRORH|nr:uncharacterized protein LOC108043205 isoform X2 [Drosophila rhopaloa]
MDFIANIIKRPKSIATTGITTTQPTGKKATETASPVDDHPSPKDREGEAPLIGTHLGTLLESASEDLLRLEEQHSSLLMDPHSTPPTSPANSSSSRETIQQLLSEINVNLNQVSANEMEHLQAMSCELSPLAVKPSPKPSSMEQQKALAAALGHQTAATGCAKMDADAAPKFGGLPEFDESQIPDLASLSAEMEAQRKSSHSDSDVFVECLSLHSERYTGDRSELEAYSSALNDVLEQQLSMTSGATLENEFEDPLAVSHYNNVSYEAMDVDDINETMEMLKDVLGPEDHQLLQQQFLIESQRIPEMDPVQIHGKQGMIEESFVLQEHLDKQEVLDSQLEDPSLKELRQSEDANEPAQCTEPNLSDLNSPREIENLHFEKMEQKQISPTQETERLNPEELLQEQEIHKVQQTSPNATLQEPNLPQDPRRFEEPLNLQELTREKKEDPVECPNQEQATPVPVETIKKTELELTEIAICLEQKKTPAVMATEDRITGEEFEPMEVDVSMRVDDATVIRSPQQQQKYSEAHFSSSPLELSEAKETTPSQHPAHEQHVDQIPEEPLKRIQLEPPESVLPAAPVSPPIPTLQAKFEELPLSPPIPTHRPKTAEELEFLALRELPLPDEADGDNMNMPMEEAKGQVLEKEQPHHCAPVVAVTPTKIRSTSPLPLDLGGNTTVCNPEPTSPSFPIRGPAEKPSHFPRSPHAPPEQEDMPYLEEAVVEPSLDRKQSLFGAGVIAKSGVVIEVTQPSPEKLQHLNETLPMSELSPTPLNGTFDSGRTMPENPELDREDIEGSPTFAASLGSVDDNQRRTFSVIQSTAEKEEAKSRRTFCMERENPRRTFCLEQNASPAVEATEDILAGDAMDVDISMRVEEVTVVGSPQQNRRDYQAPVSNSPPIPTHQNLKRAPIHETPSPTSPLGNATVILEEQALSAKEQATLSASDEKDDVFVEHFGAISPVSDDMFKTPQFTSSGFHTQAKVKANPAGENGGKAAVVLSRQRSGGAGEEEPLFDAEFKDGVSNQNLILNSSDFDYLYTKGSNNAPIDRSSLLLKFDPLLGAPVPVNHPNQQEQALLNILGSNQNQNRILSPTLEEHETSGGNHSFGILASAKDTAKKLDFKPPVDRTKKHVKMSVDVIDNDCNKTFDNSNLNTEDKSHNYNNMDELEKKIKNEVTRSEDIEKKLKEGEQREEALIKRITEKDKTNAKLNGVIEAYEKAIAELISEKEQQAQLHERQMQEVQADRDANYHHLTSLETTFSDLHVKYEKSKEMTSQLKGNEESLLAERKQMMDNLRLQEQRYDKMKNHAMQQLEIANKKLDTYAREHADESKKLKALLKKEEVSRVSMTEQLQQKSRENADLLKICEELIYGKGQDF